jgi:SM-20-related protein
VPKPDFFGRLGLYSCEGFLDAALCRQLQAAFHRGSRHAGTVGVRAGADFVVDSSVRSVDWVDVGDELASEIRGRLQEAKPGVETFYDVALNDFERLQFLAYGVGDHYQAHRDSRPDEAASATSKARRISAVIFVNGQSTAPAAGRYGGGALTFYGLVDHPSGDQIGMPLEPAEGLLMTFPSHVLHSVAPVTHGERYTIATWFS